jgi:adenosylmethionine-8-amino-7-oxononanoate aminotransferase
MSKIWHPFTQHALADEAIEIARAEGSYLYKNDGTKIIDAISSWWVNIHGHCHPKIVEAVQKQAGELEQVIFAGFTHKPAEQLADKLLDKAGKGFDSVFFSDSGSTAVEVALKMAVGYWAHSGIPKTKIVAIEGGYHGDTFGAMAAGGRGVFSKIYENMLFEVEHVAFPPSAKDLEKVLKAGDVAAFICEPLVLGAAGMKMYDAQTLKELHAVCKKHDVIFIADEVMTGWGRTGTMFACEQAGIVPDIMCLSKGLTGGFLPMGATLCVKKIYDAFYHKDRSKMFFHSSSFTGNALACAAALASLEIWETEPVMERIQNISRQHEAAAKRFAKDEMVSAVRHKGTILALDIDAGDEGYLSSLAPKLYEFYMSRGLLLRPLGNTVYVLPPYCIDESDLEKVYDGIARSLDVVRDEREQRAA